MLEFPYQPEPIAKASPAIPQGTMAQWRPFAPVWIIGPTGRSRFFTRALLDTGSSDSVFPLDLAAHINVPLLGDSGHRLRWRGQRYSLRYGNIELELSDGQQNWRWPAVVAFSDAPINYPLLGQNGCLQFFDADFLGHDRLVKVEVNPSYPGTK